VPNNKNNKQCFFWEFFFVAKVAIINRNHRFAFFLAQNFAKVRKIKENRILCHNIPFCPKNKSRQISKRNCFIKILTHLNFGL
jgi:hypothetical protein